MSVPPGSSVPPESDDNRTSPLTASTAGGSSPTNGSGFWDSEMNRLIAVVGGILVACMLLAAMAITAAVGAKALSSGNDAHPKMSRGGPHGDGPQSRGDRGQRGFGMPGGQDDDGGLGALGGLGGLRGSLDMFSKFQHGDVVVTGANGQPETKRIARGTVSEVSPTAISIKSTDGFVSTYAIAETTKVTVDGKVGATTALAVGQNAFAMGTLVGTAATAEVVSATAA